MAGFADVVLPDTVAAGVLRGRREDLARAYEILSRPVMGLAMRILQDRQLAEEVVQDAFIEMLEKSTQIRSAGAVKAWVRQVAVNHCLMRLRSPWHARRSELDAPGAQEPLADGARMDWAAHESGIERALATLSGDARAVVWLHDVEGYTHREIGEMMGKTSSFSKSQLARAHERLLRWGSQHGGDGAAQRPPGSPARGGGGDSEMNTGTKRNDNGSDLGATFPA